MAKIKKGNTYYLANSNKPLTCIVAKRHPHASSMMEDSRGKQMEVFNPELFDEPNQQKVLHMTLNREWFDMIASGEKKEEYRDVKLYWGKRFLTPFGCVRLGMQGKIDRKEIIKYDVIEFKNGYAKDAPTMQVEWKGLKGGKGKQKWGAVKGEKYFIIKLGKILSISNH